MKRIFVVLCLTVSICTVYAQQYLPKWEKGYFDIYAIATGKGENTLLVFPDGTKMVIDCGDMTGSKWNGVAVPDDTKSPARWVADFIEHFTGSSEVDYFLLSHIHSDHMGRLGAGKETKNGYELMGVSELAEYVHFGKIIDRGYPLYDFPKDQRKSKTNNNYIKFVEYQVSSGRSAAEKFQIGSHRQVSMQYSPKEYDFDVWNIAGNCEITTGKGKKTRKMYTYPEPAKFDENMFSLVQLFRYGKFRYYQGGDLSGGFWNSKGAAKKPFSRDMESQVADVIGRPVDVLKAGHHGCPDTSNPHFLWTLRPNAVIFHCIGAQHSHPKSVQRMLDHMMPGCKLLYPTQESGRQELGEKLFSKLQPAGHVVVRVYPGGNSYKIFVLDSRSRDYRIISESETFTVQ